MADDAVMAQLAAMLATPVQAQHGKRPSETVYGPHGEEYGVDYVEPPPIGALLGLRFGFRGMPQSKFPGPWAAERPPAQGPAREWKQPGDDSVGQHIYEAVLGRTRAPGDAVGKAGSGWWMVGGQPIPKPTNILGWLGAGAGGYGGYKIGAEVFDRDHKVRDDIRHRWDKGAWPEDTPGTPQYEERQKRMRESDARRDAAILDSPHRALFEYGGVNWPWQTDKWASRKNDPGVPPLPDAPY
jgi:hypothetical protein